MEIDYGRVTLSAVDLTRWERIAIWSEDQTDLLTIRNIIGANGTYAFGGSPILPSVAGLSPATQDALEGRDRTASVLIKNPRGRDPFTDVEAPVFTTEDDNEEAFHSGPETDAELRNALLRPLEKLILWAYSRQTGKRIRWLESPKPGFSTDAMNGPLPISLDVVSVAGEPHSVAVHYQVQTDLPPCASGADKAILSHRWEMTHGHDEDRYLTRTIRGTVVFHGGVIRLLGLNPDTLRNQLIHPIPLGMRRETPTVTLSSDGLTLKYTVVDVDPTIVFDPGNSGATRVDIAEKLIYQNPTTWNEDKNKK